MVGLIAASAVIVRVFGYVNSTSSYVEKLIRHCVILIDFCPEK